MAAGSHSHGEVTLAVKKEVTRDKEGKAEERGKGGKGEKVGDMYKASCHTGGIKNIKIYIYSFLFFYFLFQYILAFSFVLVYYRYVWDVEYILYIGQSIYNQF